MTTKTADVDISIPDLMDLIDQFADARVHYIKTAEGAKRAWEIRRTVERMLTQEKSARRFLERQVSEAARAIVNLESEVDRLAR